MSCWVLLRTCLLAEHLDVPNKNNFLFLRYYLTANSCYHDGYMQYNWPIGWDTSATSSGMCEDVSMDGTGIPEQFWNCAEVKILPSGASSGSFVTRSNIFTFTLMSLFSVFW